MKGLDVRPATFDLKTAAKYLGIGHHALTRALRDRGILESTEHGLAPTPAFAAFFVREPRSTQFDGPTGRITRHYVATLVTVKGLAWLADELRRVA